MDRLGRDVLGFCPTHGTPSVESDLMFSVKEKQFLATEIEKLLLSLKHPEMPTIKPRFSLKVHGNQAWSWAFITPNWTFGVDNPPSVNPWNEKARRILKS